MNKLVPLLFIAVTVVILLSNNPCDSQAFTGTTRNTGQCVVSIGGRVFRFKPGTKLRPPNQCVTCTCSRKGIFYTYTCVGCGVIAPPRGCRLVTNKRQPHPKCCPVVVCKKN